MRTPTNYQGGALAIPRSQNRKLGSGRVNATYVAQQSCPSTCPFRDAGCYAESGPTGVQTKRLNQSNLTPIELATNEAAAISLLPTEFPLRLHVVGDCPDAESAEVVSKAAASYRQQGGKPVWTYTHAWKTVPRSAWGDVSVLASCETYEDAREAIKLGYGTSMVVPKYENGAKAWKEGNLNIVPCPYETRGKTCDKCKLCWHDQTLQERKSVIAFAPHGSGAPKVQLKILAANQANNLP